MAAGKPPSVIPARPTSVPTSDLVPIQRIAVIEGLVPCIEIRGRFPVGSDAPWIACPFTRAGLPVEIGQGGIGHLVAADRT